MRTSIRVILAGLLVVGLLWIILVKGTYLVIPFAILLLSILAIMWIGYRCLQGNSHSFFRFIAACILAFLTPLLLRGTHEGLQNHTGLRYIVSGVMLLFAFWPRSMFDDMDDDDDDDDDDDYEEEDDDDDDSYVAASVSSTPASHQIKQDLKKIEGVGPAIETLMNNAGIHTFAQLASASQETLQAILKNGGDRFQMHDPFTWSDQAAMARDDQREQLERFQDLLDGGRHN